MYTASFAFFEALWEAGVRYVFVNLGSDHPSIIEAMVKGQSEKKGPSQRSLHVRTRWLLYQWRMDLPASQGKVLAL